MYLRGAACVITTKIVGPRTILDGVFDNVHSVGGQDLATMKLASLKTLDTVDLAFLQLRGLDPAGSFESTGENLTIGQKRCGDSGVADHEVGESAGCEGGFVEGYGG